MKTKRNKKLIVLTIILAVLLFQFVLTTIQVNRYHYNDEGYENYHCVHMSRDCERFFESIGIHVYQIRGKRETGIKNSEGGYETEGHRWLLLDFGWFQIHYDSISLAPWNPIWDGYTIDVEINEGYVIDSEDHEQLSGPLRIWRDFN